MGDTVPGDGDLSPSKPLRLLRQRVFSLVLFEHSVSEIILMPAPTRKSVLRAGFVRSPYEYHVSESSYQCIVLRAKRLLYVIRDQAV